MRISDWSSDVCSSDLHEAHVAEGACIHDFLETLAIEMLHILMLAFIDHIEKRGETVAQIEATAAAMTNIENPAQLCVQCFLVIETFILQRAQIGRASCRERVCQTVCLSVVAV